MSSSHQDEREVKRSKQLKKMTKMVAKAWSYPKAEPFQESSSTKKIKSVAYDLTTIGEHIDNGDYEYGKAGWEHFARDIGGVYNRHISRKTKHAKHASQHLEHVMAMLAKLDDSLAKIASKYCPKEPSEHQQQKVNKKRKVSSNDEQTFNRQTIKKKKHPVPSDSSRRKSPSEIGTVKEKAQPVKKKLKQKQMTSRECEAERRKIRRELDKLKKNHSKATKALDDFLSEQKEGQYPIDDDILMEEEMKIKTNNDQRQQKEAMALARSSCAAARIPDIDGYPGIPLHCMPDVIMTWDFLCTFGRALSLNPISLDSYVAALTYKTRVTSATGEGELIPVYLSEAHLSLLKLLLNDPTSDEWWWCTLETDEVINPIDDDIGKSGSGLPIIKVDMAALLAQEEDNLITASWLQALEDVRNHRTNAGGQIKDAVKSAQSVVANKYVKAYLKKSLIHWKSDYAGYTKRAVIWLIDRVRDARPDLWGRNVTKEAIYQQRAKVVEESMSAMEKMDEAAEAVTQEDIIDSDDEMDSDDEDEDEGSSGVDLSKGGETPNVATQDENSKPVTSPIPVRPPPTIVDLLLPPAKPVPNSDIVSPFSWPFVAGATACRILHSYKRKRNEVDDSIREFRQLPPLTIAERRQRESVACSRVLSECVADEGGKSMVEKAISHLTAGNDYLVLSPVQRLGILKLLVEAAYDTTRVHGVVNENFTSRINAVKALAAEERRARREAKEEAAEAEIAAREQLALQAKSKFLHDKRAEITERNNETHEYSAEFMDGLMDEDIAEFDEETKAEYDALPGPDNFNKAEVNKMVAKMQEENAFNTHSLLVLSMEEVVNRDKQELESVEQQLSSYGDVDSLLLSETMDRETSKNIQRLRKDIENARYLETSLPEVRETAVETLKDAIEDGTIKVLRGAVRLAKQAKLTGYDAETGGVWTLDLLRDAALELKVAEGRKRVIDAQKDLVAKRNKCFLRTEPIGQDRFRNRYWRFGADESSRVWVEVDYILEDSIKVDNNGCNNSDRVNLFSDVTSIMIGEADREEDFIEKETSNEKDEYNTFIRFSRQEYHSSGSVAALAKRHWGGHNTEKAFRGLIKSLDRRGTRENELRTNLKETLEDSGLSTGGEPKEDQNNDSTRNEEPKENQHANQGGDDNGEYSVSGDEHFFQKEKDLCAAHPTFLSDPKLVEGLSSAIGKRVRVREVLDVTKVPVLASYGMGTVTGWKMQKEEIVDPSTEEGAMSSSTERPIWRVVLDGGGEIALSGSSLIESLCRALKWKEEDPAYFEDDAAFLSYRNSLGRFCGRAADAALASTANVFARLMIKKEQELYAPLKNRTYDNNWGGKSGERNSWVLQMRDYCFDVNTASTGLLTLESAFFELTGSFSAQVDFDSENVIDAKSLLEDGNSRFNIELENIGKKIIALWSSPESRSIFREIVSSSKTIGFLALALDLLCRNCWAYLRANKPAGRNAAALVDSAPATTTGRRLNAWQQSSGSITQPATTGRRLNAWQQANEGYYY